MDGKYEGLVPRCPWCGEIVRSLEHNGMNEGVYQCGLCHLILKDYEVIGLVEDRKAEDC